MKTIIAKWKQRLGYASGYVSMFGVPLLVLNLAQEKLALMGFHVPYLVLFLLLFVGFFAFGYMLDKSGVWEAENDFAYSKLGKMKEDIQRK